MYGVSLSVCYVSANREMFCIRTTQSSYLPCMGMISPIDPVKPESVPPPYEKLLHKRLVIDVAVPFGSFSLAAGFRPSRHQFQSLPALDSTLSWADNILPRSTSHSVMWKEWRDHCCHQMDFLSAGVLLYGNAIPKQDGKSILGDVR